MPGVSQRAYARLRGVAMSAVQKAIASKRITPNRWSPSSRAGPSSSKRGRMSNGSARSRLKLSALSWGVNGVVGKPDRDVLTTGLQIGIAASLIACPGAAVWWR